MRRSSIFCVILVTIIVISAPVCLPVFAQTSGPPNPNSNVTTAYKLLHQNDTGAIVTNIPPLSINTDLPSYKQGEAVVITGHIREVENATALTLRVFSSIKNLISVAQLLPSSDGSFTKTFLATGPLWKDAGNYTIVAQYGRYTQANATFSYSGGNGQTVVTPVVNSTYQLQSGGQTYNIPYIMKGGTVQSMNIYADKFTLEISINAQTDGSITLTLPRQMIDSKVLANLTKDQIMTGVKPNPNDLEDEPFLVTVNDKPLTQFSETKNLNVRIISIPFHAGDTKIDVIGTIIVPEFGPIAALVLVIAIVSVILLSTKTKLRLIPKY